MTHFSLLAMLLALAVTSPAQEPQPAPNIVCDEPVYDFGTADSSQVIEHTFVLRNTGNAQLDIAQARASCGCTVAGITVKQVPPGATSEITSRLTLAGRNGLQQKNIVVDSNDPDQPQLVLTLRGTVANAIEIQPPNLFMNQIEAGTQPTGVVTLTASGETRFSIVAVQATSEQLVATVETLETGRVYRIAISPREPLSAAQIEARVYIQTDHPQKGTIDIPVVFVATGEIVVSPPNLAFPAPGIEPVTRYIVVRSAGGPAPQIVSIEPPDPNIAIEIAPFGGSGHQIKMANLVPNPALNGRSFRIHIGGAAPRTIDVPILVNAPAP